MTTAAPEIAAVIPCLNEAENAEAIAAAVAEQFDRAAISYEIIFIDNGSSDGTIDIIKSMCARDGRIRLISNNQNYGQMRSPTHGIYQATATRAVVGISADFQDPPELIGQFIAHWRAGAMIVLGVRETERMPLSLRIIRALGYGFFARFGDYRVIPGATGFGLYDRRVVDALKLWRDPEPFFRGMLVESGFSLSQIPYHRPGRVRGLSKNTIGTLISFGLSGLASSSKKVLRVPLYVGALAALTSVATVLTTPFVLALGGPVWSVMGWAVAQGAFAFLSLFLGLIGEQVRLISEIVRNRPLVIEAERINFPGA